MNQKNHRLKFETERLKSGPITHDIDVHPDVLDLGDDPEYVFEEPVLGQITAQHVGTNVILTGAIKTVAKAPCARCLTELRVLLRASVTLVYMEDERLRDPVRYPELYDDNTFWYDGSVVYPAEQLREQLLLQLPSVPHCELEKNDFCPVRQVHIEPMTFGPVETPGVIERKEEDKSFSAQIRKLCRDKKKQ